MDMEKVYQRKNVVNEVGPHRYDQFYYGSGKLLLTGEYFVLDGASSIALATKKGQSMGVRYTQSFDPRLVWKSFDEKGNLWFESSYEFWHFNCLDTNPSDEALFLQKILLEHLLVKKTLFIVFYLV